MIARRGIAAPRKAEDGKTRTFLLPEEMVEGMAQEAERIERSISWVAQLAWRISRKRIAGLVKGRAGGAP